MPHLRCKAKYSKTDNIQTLKTGQKNVAKQLSLRLARLTAAFSLLQLINEP